LTLAKCTVGRSPRAQEMQWPLESVQAIGTVDER